MIKFLNIVFFQGMIEGGHLTTTEDFEEAVGLVLTAHLSIHRQSTMYRVTGGKERLHKAQSLHSAVCPAPQDTRESGELPRGSRL